MIATLNGFYYRHLSEALRKDGFTESVTPDGRTFFHPSGARLMLPAVEDDEPLRAYHYAAARAMVDDYGILSRDAFDLQMSGIAGRTSIALAN